MPVSMLKKRMRSTTAHTAVMAPFCTVTKRASFQLPGIPTEAMKTYNE